MANNRNHTKLITVISIVLPIAVAVLFRVKIEGYDFSFLPGIYAGIRSEEQHV